LIPRRYRDSTNYILAESYGIVISKKFQLNLTVTTDHLYKMSKLDDLLVKFTADLEAIGEKVDQKFLRAVAKSCGPAIYKKDASLVALSDKAEVERVRKNFLIGKLGLKDTPKLDEGIAAAKAKYSKRNKSRAVFYYLLAKHFKKRAAIMG